MRVTAGGLVLVLSAGLLAGCSGSDGVKAGPSPSVTQPVVLDDLFEVAPGRKLHLSCVGSGPVTVLLEAGGGAGSNSWPASITQQLSEKTRTCTYDRAGTGASDPAPDRRRMMVDVDRDLDALLAAAGIQGRLLLVGASFGGQVVLDWGLHHPARTAGLVILDTDWPTGDVSRSPDKLLSAAERAQERAGDRWDSSENVEHVDYQETGAETEAAFRTLPGIPIRVLSATKGDCDPATPACRQQVSLSVSLQRQWLRLSPTAVQKTVDAGHDLAQEATDVVLTEINAALTEALQSAS